MRGILVEKCGGVDVLQLRSDLPMPTPGSREVVVQNAFTGVNYIDTYHRTGLYPLPLPFTPGREGAGIVTAVGSEVSDFAVGDRVAYVSPSTYAEYTPVSVTKMTKLPANVSFENAVCAMLQGLTAMMLAKHTYHVKSGDWVLVHAAAGGVGQLLCQVCKALGAHVIGTTSSEEKAKIAKEAGAEYVILYTHQDVATEVKRITNNVGVAVAYDGVGKSTLDASLASLKTRGWLVVYGNASGKPDPIDITRLTKGSLTVQRPSLFDFIGTQEEFRSLCDDLFNNFILPGKLNFKIHKVYDLEDVASAHADIEGRKTTGKLLIKIQP